MKPELERVKSDVEIIQKAMGLAPSMGREWVAWMKRNQWFSLWWCLPGLILILSALLPVDDGRRFFGLVPGQWAGVLVAAVMLAITAVHSRRVVADDGRPPAVIRECKRLNGMSGEGLWFSLALLVQAMLFVFWAKWYHLAFEPCWAGLFILTGATFLVVSVSTKLWSLLGWGVPFLIYGLCVPLTETHPKAKSVLFGMMFIAVALSFSLIQVWQIRQMERRHESN